MPKSQGGQNPPQPKRHHFVPEMILKRFTNSRGKLFYFDKRIPSGGVSEASTRELFFKKHLYSEFRPDGSKDASLEIELSKLETRAGEVVEKIVTSAKIGRAPLLTTTEKRTWDTFLGIQLKRLPDIYEKHMTPEAFGKSDLSPKFHPVGSRVC